MFRQFPTQQCIIGFGWVLCCCSYSLPCFPATLLSGHSHALPRLMQIRPVASRRSLVGGKGPESIDSKRQNILHDNYILRSDAELGCRYLIYLHSLCHQQDTTNAKKVQASAPAGRKKFRNVCFFSC